jgi:hypothetical protein
MTAAAVAGTLFIAVYRLAAPHMPPYVGAADLHISKTLSLPATPHFRLENGDGAVEVLTSDNDADNAIRIESDIRAYVHGKMAGDTANTLAQSLVMAEQRDGDSVVVTHPISPPPGIDFVVDYRIYVPAGTDIEIVGGNGNLLVHPGCGAVEARGINADIKISEAAGRVVAESTNGRITVNDIVADAQIETVNGDIRAVSKGGRLLAISTNGGVYARLIGDDVQSANLTSQNGPVAVDVPSAMGLEVTAVGAGLPLRRVLGLDDTDPEAGVVTATIGNGETILNLETVTGTIAMKRRP